MAQIINGKEISAKVRGDIAKKVSELKTKGITPGLAVVIVGEDPASKVYVRNKHRACEETGIYSEVHELPEATSESELIALIDKLNADKKINGILVQLPLPKHLDEKVII
ncbi:MAG: bifunctional 5,10-methylene-tetrahydrofolate dehydrogenase/5,10-methylene-tetrahydrofolate cyclohydrolase, partial [Clostridia bacterium]|nr:bifunctional 5,10-methylene-tetrahydrofolate dehydrogenase/5,10-methylene-tetrahydrofolate cyclohydrolase [Clostridia bacterium]